MSYTTLLSFGTLPPVLMHAFWQNEGPTEGERQGERLRFSPEESMRALGISQRVSTATMVPSVDRSIQVVYSFSMLIDDIVSPWYMPTSSSLVIYSLSLPCG